MLSLNQSWEVFIDIVEASLPRESFNTWIKPIRLISANGTEILVQVPSQFYYDWIEEHYAAEIRNALEKSFSADHKLVYSILENDRRDALKISPSRSFHSASNKKTERTKLNPRYTFVNFIEGECNSFARAAALVVAEAPGRTHFNPLVVYGGVGLGKTHLVQAIGNFALVHKSAKKVIYVSSEEFTFDFINSVKENKTTDFSRLFRSADLLIVDDVQFFEGKERTQLEFFHTFNNLYQAGKQIVLSFDRPPNELKETTSRLISRFQSGLVTDLKPPDYETRVAILRKRIEDDGIYFSEDIIDFLAQNINSNIRELEGSLIRLMAHMSITGQEIDLSSAKRILKDVITRKPKKVAIEAIQETVAELTGIPSDQIRGPSRKKPVVEARQLAIYICSQMTNLTQISIGSHFGNRDHATVIHSINKIKSRIEGDSRFRENVDDIIRKIETNSI